ncbi:hypothetical protein D8674_024620 [Pyrus ussuriensis x Pyrus communis]|uniref:Uncharacterized protein n=1 Tax=Pyrus ussuriensis x Pyrus communis TaxID=2448454 RepID=A0A5N5H4F0_9ROSA|nr:hypothetical protein D8674_024620 [Pyrus ussuriensis x Pyrus communis]
MQTRRNSGSMLCLVCAGQNGRVVPFCVCCRCSIGQMETLQKKERPKGYTVTIRSNLEWRCRDEVHIEATRKRMRRKVAKGRCRVEEVYSGREEKMIV